MNCGATGGYVQPNRGDSPWRPRGLCAACYGRHYRAGTIDQFAPMGVGRPKQPDHPAPPPERVELVAPRTLLPWGAPQTPEWRRAVAYEERRAAEWLAARQGQAA